MLPLQGQGQTFEAASRRPRTRTVDPRPIKTGRFETGSRANLRVCRGMSEPRIARVARGWPRRLTHRCHILESVNDSFRFKNSSAKAVKPAKEKPHQLGDNLTQTHHHAGSLLDGSPGAMGFQRI